MTAKSMKKVNENKVLFGVVNFTDKPITLSKDCHLGKFVCMSKNDQIFDLESVDTESKICNLH